MTETVNWLGERSIPIHVSTLRRLIAQGRFPSLRVGGRIWVPETDLSAWIAQGGEKRGVA